MNPYLETKRVFLRELTLNDEENLLELDSDVEVMKYLTFGVPSRRDEIKEHLKIMTQLLITHKGHFGFWAAVEKETHEFMGWFHFRPDKKEPLNTKRIELGYRLKKNFWGQGHATEISKALLEKGFKMFNLDEIFAITMKDNLASRKVMEKVGLNFIHEYNDETFPVDYGKGVLYRLNKNDYFIEEKYI